MLASALLRTDRAASRWPETKYNCPMNVIKNSGRTKLPSA